MISNDSFFVLCIKSKSLIIISKENLKIFSYFSPAHRGCSGLARLETVSSPGCNYDESCPHDYDHVYSLFSVKMCIQKKHISFSVLFFSCFWGGGALILLCEIDLSPKCGIGGEIARQGIL